ncbi:hypothetical protein CONCODRAFT_3123, partial [Conidiobolus coronatus NRRL 28638]
MNLISLVFLSLVSANDRKSRTIHDAGFDDLNSFANANGIEIESINKSEEIDVDSSLPVCIIGA